MFLNECIGEEYKKWNGGINIFLGAHTGAGKSYFIVNQLVKFAIDNDESILILVPRVTLYEKYMMDIFAYAVDNKISEIGKHVNVMTYQELECELKKTDKLRGYDYYVSDECHYFLSDSMFNNNTFISYKKLINCIRCKAKIFISATGERIFDNIKDWLQCGTEKDISRTNLDNRNKFIPMFRVFKEYYLEPDYSYISVKYMSSASKIVDIVSNDMEGRWIIFVNSVKRGKECFEELVEKDISAVFLKSENLKDNMEFVKRITTFEKFKEHVLISTSVIETGVNFKDKNIKNIIIFAETKEQFVQMVGRKRRMCIDDRLTVYIPQWDSNFFERRYEYYMDLFVECSKILQEDMSDIDICELMMNNSECVGVIKCLFYRCGSTLRVNKLFLQELKYRMDLSKLFVERLEKDSNAFIKEQLNWLGLEHTFDDSNYIDNELREKYFNRFIEIVETQIKEESIVGVGEGKEVLMRLKECVKHINPIFIKSGVFSYNSFNSFCEGYHLPYQCKSNNRAKGGTTYTFTNEEKTCV